MEEIGSPASSPRLRNNSEVQVNIGSPQEIELGNMSLDFTIVNVPELPGYENIAGSDSKFRRFMKDAACQFLWRLFMIRSRVLALALF